MSDSFTYDPNTGWMTQYKFNVNGQSVVGALTWNANGTLGTLGITDAFNSANTQNCSYTHDDLARIASGNCGSVRATDLQLRRLWKHHQNGQRAVPAGV